LFKCYQTKTKGSGNYAPLCDDVMPMQKLQGKGSSWGG